MRRAALALVVACSASLTEGLPPDWNADLPMGVADDGDPRSDVVDVHLEAKIARVEIEPGHTVEMWTYDGKSPGPLLRAHVGDLLRVHFVNHLPAPTTIHWHGLEVPAAMDGADPSYPTIAPGGTFDFEFRLPHAGTYWYHPHVDSAGQLWRGLYGALIVTDPNEPRLGDEVVLTLHDVQLDAKGELEPVDKLGDLGRFFGTEGATLLVNGRVMPTLRVYPEEPVRLRIVNTSLSRYYRVAIPGASLTRIAGDSELATTPTLVSDAVVAPGQRVELVAVAHGEPGAALTVRALSHDRFACGAGCNPDRDLMRVLLEDGRGPGSSIPPKLSTIAPLDVSGAIHDQIVLSGVQGQTLLAINGHSWPADPLVLMAKVGETRVWEIKNDTDYDHPFHLHGFRFQLLTRDDKPVPLTEWMDTMDVPRRTRANIAIHFDDRPGMWMFHCHILDHAEIGMMGMVHLMP